MPNNNSQLEEQERLQAWRRARREKLIVSLLFFAGAVLALALMFWR